MSMFHLRSYLQTWTLSLLCLGPIILTSISAASAATLTVTNTNSSGTGSLSQAISSAASGDVIVFAPSVSGTITGSLDINENLTIQGPTTNKIILSASSSDRVLNINSGTVSLSNLTFTGGNSSNGGGIYTNSPLTLTGCTIFGNSALQGGGLYGDTSGVLTLINCTVANNNASSDAGGIFCKNTLTLTSCTIVGNSSASSGGGLYSSGSATLTSNIIALNTGGDLSGNVTSSGSNIVSDTNGNGLYNGINNDQTGLNAATLKLGTLADNGGPTSTMLPQATSPAVAGDYNNPTATDQRGHLRPTGLHTIGAAEYPTAPPTPVNDSASVNKNQSLMVAAPGVLANDSDPQGQALTAGAASTPSHGAVTLNSDGSFTYTPTVGFLGTDSFRYSAINASGIAATATVSLTVTPPTVRLVSPTGSDSNNGDPTHPMLTIQAAINASRNGDTVLIADGTYTGPGDVDLNFGGRNITVTSEHGAARTIINCGGSGGRNDHRGFILDSGETNAVIHGLTIENGYESADFGGGIYILTMSSGTITVDGCILADNTSYYGGGGILCENNGSCTITVTNCVLTGNQTIYDVGGGLYTLTNNSPMKVISCTLSGNTAPSGHSGGIYVYTANASFPTVLTDDVIYGNTGGEVMDDPQSVIPAAASHCDVSGGYSGTDDLNTDPLFVNSPVDLHLQSSSPCLGAGTAIGAPTIDLDGNTRVTPPSIGAYDASSAPALQSLTVTPTSASVTTGLTQMLKVTAHYSDSSTADVTAQATWSSRNLTVATVSAQGIVTAGHVGVDRITANFSGQSARVTLIVTDPDAATACNALWTRTDSEFSLWQFPAGGFADHNFDPIPGYTAQALAMTPDGHAHFLLTAADGTALLDDALVPSLTTDHNAGTQTSLGPFPNWTPLALAAGNDGTLHLLWSGTGSLGSMALWTLPAGGPATHQEYGPYPGWTPLTLSVAPDNTPRVLWLNTDGQVSFWVVGPHGGFQHFEFGPYPGWTPSALATGPDGLNRLTWNHAGDGLTALWTLTDAGRFVPVALGSYSGWSLSSLAVGGDDTLHMGWDGAAGEMSLWSLPDTDLLAYTHAEYGPFTETGWSLKALSAIP